VKGLGIDLCEISRIEKAMQRNESFLNRYFTQQERDYLTGRGNMAAQSAAAMFAAKEAFLKAVGTGIGRGIPLEDVGVAHDELGAPHYALTNAAAERMHALGASAAWLSLTHEAGMAAAVCVIE